MPSGGGGAPQGVDDDVLGRIRDEQKKTLETAERRRAERALESFTRSVGVAVLRGAIVGASCAAVPGACPAILAVNSALKLGKAGAEVYEAYRKAPTPAVGVRAAARQGAEAAVAMTLSDIAVRNADDEIRGTAAALGSAAIAAGLDKAFHIDEDVARLLFEATVYQSLKEGVGGLITWGLRELAG